MAILQNNHSGSSISDAFSKNLKKNYDISFRSSVTGKFVPATSLQKPKKAKPKK